MINNSNPLMNTYSYLPVNLVKGNKCKLYDNNNKEYIDFTSGIGVNSLGYNHTAWIEAVKVSASTLHHISNLFLNENTLKLANKLTSLSKMDKVFFSNSGAEANEGAIKLARKYSFDKYGFDRNKILTLKQSFHGRTLATLKATGQDKFHNYFFPFPDGFDYVEANNIDNFKSKLTNNVCAILMESIQGEGGVFPLDNIFVQEVVEICNKKDILVIFDEVQCGIGRTGKLFGFNHFNINPDIITFAKGIGGGLPIGGFLCNKKLSTVLNPGDHGTTYGGNPVACSAALVVLDTICNDEIYREISKKGELIKKSLEALNSPVIKEIRGHGLMIGIETTLESSLIQREALSKGLLTLTAGKNVIRLLPPLIIDYEDLSKGIEILSNSINKLSKN
ncbi:aspartate aminotransferase family protein [Clostridium carnis]